MTKKQQQAQARRDLLVRGTADRIMKTIEAAVRDVVALETKTILHTLTPQIADMVVRTLREDHERYTKKCPVCGRWRL